MDHNKFVLLYLLAIFVIVIGIVGFLAFNFRESAKAQNSLIEQKTKFLVDAKEGNHRIDMDVIVWNNDTQSIVTEIHTSDYGFESVFLSKNYTYCFFTNGKPDHYVNRECVFRTMQDSMEMTLHPIKVGRLVVGNISLRDGETSEVIEMNSNGLIRNATICVDWGVSVISAYIDGYPECPSPESSETFMDCYCLGDLNNGTNILRLKYKSFVPLTFDFIKLKFYDMDYNLRDNTGIMYYFYGKEDLGMTNFVKEYK